jgi:ATP-dependent Clp protease ATP-binding subunit ClpC
MTSNIGSDIIKGGANFGFQKRQEVQDYEKIKKSLQSEAEKFFRPEFINRLDDMIVFRPLVKADLTHIIDLELAKVKDRLKARGMTLEVSEPAKDFLIEKGYNPDFGARPLRRALAQYVEDPLAERLLSGEFADGTAISATREDGKEYLSFEGKSSKGEAPKAEPQPA